MDSFFISIEGKCHHEQGKERANREGWTFFRPYRHGHLSLSHTGPGREHLLSSGRDRDHHRSRSFGNELNLGNVNSKEYIYSPELNVNIEKKKKPSCL